MFLYHSESTRFIKHGVESWKVIKVNKLRIANDG